MVYADREGNIGYYGPGRIPIRAKGDGTAPVPGWNSEYEWEGWIPFDDLPHVFNPAEGYIVTANNKVVTDDYPYFISSSWAPPYRAERVVELLEQMTSGGRKLSRGGMVAIQGDQVSRQVQELMPYLLAIKPEDERQAAALDYLRGWDGQMSAESVAPTIYTAWLHQLGLVVFEDDLHGDIYEQFADRRHASFLAGVLSESASPWCDNVLTVPSESCADASTQALQRALDGLVERLGKEMVGWQWGEIHQTMYTHNPFSEVGAMRPIFQRQIGNGGGPYTINVGPYKLSEPYRQTAVPSYRQIVDLGDWNSSLFMHTTGQSGNVLSRHYDDLIGRHQAVEYLHMSFGRENVVGDVLVLKPD
jgi:penicillin amidase